MKYREKPMKQKYLNRIMGRKIKYLRGVAGYTQEDLANMIGRSRPSIVNIEEGRQSISSELLYLLCGIFKKTPNFFYPPIMRPIIKKKRIKRTVIVKTKDVYQKVNFNQ